MFYHIISSMILCGIDFFFVLEFFSVIICAETIFWFFFVLEFFLVIIGAETFFYVSHRIDPLFSKWYPTGLLFYFLFRNICWKNWILVNPSWILVNLFLLNVFIHFITWLWLIFCIFFPIYTPTCNFNWFLLFLNFNKKILIYFYFWPIFNTPSPAYVPSN